jgi:hypothetical protein
MKPWKSFVLLAVMFPAGCEAAGEETSGEVPPSAPDVTAIAGGQEHDLSFVTSTWNVELPEGEQQTMQTDGTGLQAVADHPSQVEADSGNSVDIRFENGRNPDQIVGYWKRGQEQEKAETLEDKTSLKLPEEAGTYMYEMHTQWSGSDYEGEVTYAIKVKVLE